MVLMGIFVVGKIDPKPEQRMGQITIKTVHEVPSSRIFRRCSRGVELHPRRGSATRFSTAAIAHARANRYLAELRTLVGGADPDVRRAVNSAASYLRRANALRSK